MGNRFLEFTIALKNMYNKCKFERFVFSQKNVMSHCHENNNTIEASAIMLPLYFSSDYKYPIRPFYKF